MKLSVSSSSLVSGRQTDLEFFIPPDLEPGVYPLRLRLERERDGAVIHFANEGWEDSDFVPIGVLNRK